MQVQSSWPDAEHGERLPLHETAVSASVFEVRLGASPIKLQRSPPEGTAPCTIVLEWPEPQPHRKLSFAVMASARNVEVHVEGRRRSMLGEVEDGEVYVGTFRGTTQDRQVFDVEGNADACASLLSIQRMRLKFVSLVGDKSTITINQLCITRTSVERQPSAPSAPSTAAPSSSSSAATAGPSVAEQLGKLSLGAPGLPLDLQTVMPLVQTMQAQMEANILQALEAKLAVFSQRVTLSESRLLQLQQRMDDKHDVLQRHVAVMHDQLNTLTTQVRQLSGSNNSEPQRAEEPEDELVSSRACPEVELATS